MTNSRVCAKPDTFQRRSFGQKFSYLLIFAAAFLVEGCGISSERRNMPPDVESAIHTIIDNISHERYEVIYRDASELWRQDVSLEESINSFKTLQVKLGAAENRTLQTAKEQENSGGPLKGRVYIVVYKTKFEDGEGMETFTLVDRGGQWKLARYFVSSTALQ
jgi:Protein of unknown function (DUF4019)